MKGLILFLYLLFLNNLFAQSEGIGVEEKIGQGIPVGPEFYTEFGEKIQLDKFLEKKPVVILTPVYYTCPNLCNFILNGLMRAVVKETKLKLGKDYLIVSFSINPLETPELARAKKQNYVKQILKERRDFSQDDIENGWFFLTAPEESIFSLTKAIGFFYRREGGEYQHQAAIVFLNKDGVISRYLYGIDFPSSDFKMALVETARGQIGGITEKIAMYCFSYDPVKKKYSLVAWKVMRLAASAGAVVFLIFLGFFWYFEMLKKKRAQKES